MDRERFHLTSVARHSSRLGIVNFGSGPCGTVNPKSEIQMRKDLGFATEDYSWCAFIGETTAPSRLQMRGLGQIGDRMWKRVASAQRATHFRLPPNPTSQIGASLNGSSGKQDFARGLLNQLWTYSCEDRCKTCSSENGYLR